MLALPRHQRPRRKPLSAAPRSAALTALPRGIVVQPRMGATNQCIMFYLFLYPDLSTEATA
jgi:hypothetical protein